MKKSIKILLILIFAFAFLSIISKVEAASASISASKSTATVGDSVTINISFNAAAWNLKVSGAGLSSSYADVTSDGENAKTSKSFKLNTSSTGTKTVKLTGDVTDGKTGVTTQVNKSVTVTINKKQTNNNNNNNNNGNASNQSENNTPTTPEPTFTSVNETVYALSKANVRSSYSTSSSIVGSLKVGDSVTRTGIGSNGWSKITYNGTTAYVSSGLITKTKPKEEEPQENENNDDENEENEKTKLVLSSLKIENYDLNPEFSKDIYEYEVNIENDVDNLKIDAISDDADVTIEIDGNKNLKVGENNITITISKEKTKEETIYKIKAIKEESNNVEVVAKINQDLLNEEIDRTNNNLKIREWTIRGIIIFVTILIIIIFILRFFTTREDNQDYEYDYVNIKEKFNELNDESEVKDENEDQKYDYEEESPKINKRNKGKHF